ncbi:MAG: hypothetical protein KJO69_01925 [Gammaproteobacteria bacterium]|nr:hypothetical protein [Gammaproteobacteria bacterium]
MIEVNRRNIDLAQQLINFIVGENERLKRPYNIRNIYVLPIQSSYITHLYGQVKDAGMIKIIYSDKTANGWLRSVDFIITEDLENLAEYMQL